MISYGHDPGQFTLTLACGQFEYSLFEKRYLNCKDEKNNRETWDVYLLSAKI